MSKKRGSNFIPLVLDTRLLMVINGKASQKNQLNATYIMSVLVEHSKDELKPQAYEELKERYSKTVYQQKEEKLANEKAKFEREKKKLALKEKELKFKEQNAETYREQTNKARRRELLQKRARLKQTVETPEVKAELEEINRQLKELGVDTD